jgi:GTP-binding protein
MIPADSDDISREYGILLNELRQYNPELLDKQRLLVITKSDLLDDELIDEIRTELPDVRYHFISAVANLGLVALNDTIWKMLNS